ncbi:hypothetical protein MAM1_0400d10331 [Mucor ambiguus]|uniref:Uncharacterized protein n=1 Tax=Mucor ambiguus TaxID=91626 RepID=A0A0C9N843_9FUNG|nr:hypothetical protein MAM1_0400d10331 [Mucor ambiguus]
MYAYHQHRPHFYQDQRHWEEVHHPLSPNPYEMYHENDYYYSDPIHNKRHGQYDTSRRRKSGTFEDYSTQHPPTSNRYADTYYPNADYYYYEPAEDETNDLYYYHQHQNPHHHRHGARSASPSKRKDRKREHSRLHHKSSFKKNEAWIQPTPFVNPQPMIMDPMMSLQHQQQQILGTCTTDAIMPIIPNNFGLMPQAPMINHTQPYFMPLPPASTNYPPPYAFHHQQQQQTMLPFVQPMPPPSLLNDLFNNLSLQDNNKSVNEANQTETTNVNQAPSPAQQEEHSETTPSTPLTRPTERPLQRRRSMMETVLSSFSLLGDNQSSTNLAHKSWDPSSYVSLNEALRLGTTSNANDVDANNESALSSSLSPRSVASASSAVAASTTKNEENGSATLSRRDSLKLSQKMNALQSRHYIWCYKPQNNEAALWAAFDVKNQRKLDHHYAKLTSKKQQMIQQQQQQQKENDKDAATAASASDTKVTTSFLPDDVITLSKQSQLHGPVIVSLNKATAWCFDNDSSFSFGSSGQKHILLDIACLPSQQNRFVVSNQLVFKDPVVRRSKSVDGGLATKFINSVLKW